MSPEQDKTIAKLQHFYELLQTRKYVSESCAIVENGDIRQVCNAQAQAYEEMIKEFIKMFEKYLYSE